jgi:hypothetical protein
MLVKIEFCRQIFEKYANIKFRENPSRGSRLIPHERTDRRVDGRTDRQTDKHAAANSRFSQFCEGIKNRLYLI